MKTAVKLFIFLLTSAYALVSCKEDAIDPLSGMYTPPGEYDFTVLDSQAKVKEGSLYIFSVNLKDAESNSLNMKFVGSDYFLPASDFTPSTTAAKKTYLIGSDGSTFNGQQIASGTLTVQSEDSSYTMNGILYMADESVIKVTAAFTIAYEPDPYVPTYTYSDETETPAMGGSDGTLEITGATKHKITVYADDVLFAYIEVIADENATSLSGTYTIKDGIDAIGQVNNGYYLDWTWWGGTGTMEGGSWYIKADEKMFLREGEGGITIADESGTLTITGTNLGILDVPALIASSGATWSNLETPGSLDIQKATEIDGGGSGSEFTYVVTVTAPATYGWAGTVIDGSQLNVIKIVNASNDTVAQFELITTEGATDLSGDYNVVDGTVVDVVIGDANNGAYIDWSWWGMGTDISYAGCWYADAGENQYIRAGSVIHVVDNGGTLSISGSDLALLDVDALISSSGATWQNLAETGSFSFTDVPVAGGGGGGNNDVSLTNLIAASALDLSLYGGTGYIVTVKIATDNVTGTYNATTYGYDFAGNGNYISIDFNRDEATLIAGTYNIVDNTTATVGDCTAGYPNPYGEGTWGSVWGTVTDDVASDLAISAGTVEVSVDGDTYTITADVTTDSGNVKASYSGPITIQ